MAATEVSKQVAYAVGTHIKTEVSKQVAYVVGTHIKTEVSKQVAYVVGGTAPVPPPSGTQPVIMCVC